MELCTGKESKTQLHTQQREGEKTEDQCYVLFTLHFNNTYYLVEKGIER